MRSPPLPLATALHRLPFARSYGHLSCEICVRGGSVSGTTLSQKAFADSEAFRHSQVVQMRLGFFGINPFSQCVDVDSRSLRGSQCLSVLTRMSCLPFCFWWLVAETVFEIWLSLGSFLPFGSFLFSALLVPKMHHPQSYFINICLFEGERLLCSNVSGGQAHENTTIVGIALAWHEHNRWMARVYTPIRGGSSLYSGIDFERSRTGKGSSGGRKKGVVWAVGQERLGPSYFFISLVLGSLNSLVW